MLFWHFLFNSDLRLLMVVIEDFLLLIGCFHEEGLLIEYDVGDTFKGKTKQLVDIHSTKVVDKEGDFKADPFTG